MTAVDIWIVMPMLILACGALLTLLLGAVVPGRYGTAIGIVAAAGAALWSMQQPPQAFSTLSGIAATPFSRAFIVLFSAAAAVTLLLSHDYNARREIIGEEYPATVLFATLGMAVLATASNLLIFFLGLEALTFAFYILVAMDLKRAASAEAGLKYLLLGAVAAAFLAFGIALIYAGSGTLEIKTAMELQSKAGEARPLLLAGWGFLLIGLAFKASLVPAHLWTPDVYEGAPAPVVAFLSTGSKGAAFAALLMLVTPMKSLETLHLPLWWLALLSMAVGNLAALLQSNLKRMFAYSSIAQMGYVTLALLTGSREGFTAVVLYVIIYTAMNLAAFGAITSLAGTSELENLEDYRGLGYSRPFQSVVLALAMFALAGIPPTAGFIGKFFIFMAAIRGGETALAVFGILTAAVSVYFYLRVVVNLYMRPAELPVEIQPATSAESIALTTTSLFILAAGIYPDPLLQLIDTVFR